MDFYPDILLEALHEASIVPLGQETTFHAMRAFGAHDMTLPFLLAVTGALLGHLVNWYVGRTLLYFEHKGKFRINPHWYERLRDMADKYGVFLLLFSWLPLCNLLTVAGGFFKLPLKKVMPFIAAGLLAHYGMALR